MIAVSDSQREILVHMLGVNKTQKGAPNRNYFNAQPGGEYFADLEAMAGAGLVRRGKDAIGGGSVYFHATVQGVQLVMGLRVPAEAIEEWFKTGTWPKGVR